MMGGTAPRHYGDHGGRTAVCCAAYRSKTSIDEGEQMQPNQLQREGDLSVLLELDLLTLALDNYALANARGVTVTECPATRAAASWTSSARAG